jgi:hypothetical protein
MVRLGGVDWRTRFGGVLLRFFSCFCVKHVCDMSRARAVGRFDSVWLALDCKEATGMGASNLLTFHMSVPGPACAMLCS